MFQHSLLNNYQYTTKSTPDKILDFLSFPLRTSLNGRTIGVLNKPENFPSTTKRIICFITSFVFFPIGVVGGVCLLLKRTRAKKEIGGCAFDHIWNNPYQFRNDILEPLTINTEQGRSTRIEVNNYFFSFSMLEFCHCLKMPGVLRNRLENDSIELLSQKQTNKEKTITLVSLGPGKFYQEFAYLAKMAHAGYKKIRFIGIDTDTSTSTHHLDSACKNIIPAKITIEKLNSLNDYVAKAIKDKTLCPDLLLLIDLNDLNLSVDGQLLSKYSFKQLYNNNLLKKGAVISHSTYQEDRTKTSLEDPRIDAISWVFSGFFTESAKDLSSINKKSWNYKFKYLPCTHTHKN